MGGTQIQKHQRNEKAAVRLYPKCENLSLIDLWTFKPQILFCFTHHLWQLQQLHLLMLSTDWKPFCFISLRHGGHPIAPPMAWPLARFDYLLISRGKNRRKKQKKDSREKIFFKFRRLESKGKQTQHYTIKSFFVCFFDKQANEQRNC